jgi:hypothetical protein
MQPSFQCPHCSQLFNASPEMYGQTCACQNCDGLFFVPALDKPSDGGGGDWGNGLAAPDQLAMSFASERRQLEEEIGELRKNVSLKEEECGRLIAERDNLQTLLQAQASTLRKLEVDLAESSSSLQVLRGEFEAREKLLRIADEKGKRTDERISELSAELRKLGDLEEEWKKAVQRVHQLESDAATSAARIDKDRIEGIELREKVVSVQQERDAFAAKIKELRSSLEQSSNRVVEFQKQAAEWHSKFEGASKAADFEKEERAREAQASKVQLRDAVERIKRLEEDCGKRVRELEVEKANRREDLEKLAAAEKERDVFLKSIETLKLQSEESFNRSNELEILTRELRSNLENSRQAADVQSKRHEADSRAYEEQLKVSKRRIENLEADCAGVEKELKKAKEIQFNAITKLEVAEGDRDALARSLEAVRIELMQAFNRAGELEKLTEEMALSLGESNRALDYHKNKALEDSQVYTEKLDELTLRIAQVEADHSKSQGEVESIGASHIKALEKLAAAVKERDDLRQVNAGLRLELEQSAKHTRELGESANALRLRLDESFKPVDSRKNMEGDIAALQSQLEKASDSERYWREQAGVFERQTLLAAGQVSRLEGDILESESACEALRLQIAREKEELAPVLAATNLVAKPREADLLRARIAELEAQECDRKEKEVDLKRQLAAKGEEREMMRRRITQIEQGVKWGAARGTAFSALKVLFWGLVEAPERLVRGLLPRLAGGGTASRRVVGLGIWTLLTGISLFKVFNVTEKNLGLDWERGSPGPGNLVETIPVLRDIESDSDHESRKEELPPPTGSDEKAPSHLALARIVEGSPDSQLSNPKVVPQEAAVVSSSLPSTAQGNTKEMPAVEIVQTADSATQLGSSASAVRKETAQIGEVLSEGKETLKSLNRTPLPSQFLGTPFGTAVVEVANLANWTESSGRFRRKATLVGAPVEAVLIPDHKKRIMAGAYVRICPRSTESLAPFLEWAVGVQDAIDAEYGEPSSVHEVSEADDAAGVVERIATGRDFYEALWERQSDDGLIVLSIRAFNERSVVFRLEYLHRAMLAAYTEQQKEEAQQKEELPQKGDSAFPQKEAAQDEQSRPARN